MITILITIADKKEGHGKTFASATPKILGVDWEWVGSGTGPVLVQYTVLPGGCTLNMCPNSQRVIIQGKIIVDLFT